MKLTKTAGANAQAARMEEGERGGQIKNWGRRRGVYSATIQII
jgi:hypothetical protein